MTRFFTTIARAVALVTALSLPSLALASSDDRPVTDDVRAAITATLEAQGYQVFTIETERGGFEVKAAREGRLWELRLNADHEITRTELED
jgi:hypothetical protein